MHSPGLDRSFGKEGKSATKTLGFLKGGALVKDRFNSHLHEQANIQELLSEALQNVDPHDRDFIVESVDFGRTIGVSECVETNPNDEIVFAQRQGRNGLTRFTKSREPEPTSLLTFGLLKDKEAEKPQFICVFAFMGAKAEPEPWDPKATPNSTAFWNTHALAWGSAPIIEGTETTEKPAEFSL